MKRVEEATSKTLNLISCENIIGATEKLRGFILEHLPSDPNARVHTYMSSNVGFANCSVDRIVPPQEEPNLSEGQSASPDLDVAV